jgi:hypothetical protein
MTLGLPDTNRMPSPRHERSWHNFGLFAVPAIVSTAALFGILVLAAWITS